VWGDGLLAALPGGARAVFRAGRWLSADGGEAIYGVPNSWHVERAAERRLEVEAALGEHFGTPIRVRVVVDPAESGAPSPEAQPAAAQPAMDESYTSADVAEMESAPAPGTTAERARRAVESAFPGLTEVTE
jgi:hypothetical protein